MTEITLHSVSKHLGSTLAVDGVELAIRSGELFFLLGPSGSGKSTLLFLIAGLLDPDEGRICMGGQDVTQVPTQARSAVLCFQGYALWPHLSVRENVEFSLKARGMGKAQRAQKVRQALGVVRMPELADRMPGELSGGQQQRVAIARAIAAEPACLLLDEPLSNLDTKLRLEMRSELRRICRETGITTIYVTHDRQEALSLADRIAILSSGRLEQVGTPREVFAQPRTCFVADFLAQANLIPATVEERLAGPLQEPRLCKVRLSTPLGRLVAYCPAAWAESRRRLTLSVRPDQLQAVGPAEVESSDEAACRNRVCGRVVESWFLGDASEHLLDVAGTSLRVRCAPAQMVSPEQMIVALPPSSLWLIEEQLSQPAVSNT